MTPTEQDKELREILESAYSSAYQRGLNGNTPNLIKLDIDAIIQLITADRKRVELEAERAGHVHAARALKHQAELLGGTPDYMLKQFDVHIERHKAKQEEGK